MLEASILKSINYTFPALAIVLGVSKEIVYFCPPSLSILSQTCPRWQDPNGKIHPGVLTFIAVQESTGARQVPGSFLQ